MGQPVGGGSSNRFHFYAMLCPRLTIAIKTAGCATLKWGQGLAGSSLLLENGHPVRVLGLVAWAGARLRDDETGQWVRS